MGGEHKPRKVQGPGHKYRSTIQHMKVVHQVIALKKYLAKIYQAIDDANEWKTVNIASIRVKEI